jgi:hypothetical protein
MRLTQFHGVIPKLRSERLPGGYAAFAENCLLHSGSITPIRAAKEAGDAVDLLGNKLPSAPAVLHRVGAAWLGFPTPVFLTRDPLPVCGQHGFLFVQDGRLWRSSGARIAQGLPAVEVGIDRPTQAPLAQSTGLRCDNTDYGSGDCWEDVLEPCTPDLPPQAVAYCHTWVTEFGEESGCSPYTEVMNINPLNSVALSAVSAAPANAVKIRWYVLLAAQDTAHMMLVGETPLPQMVFIYCPTYMTGVDPLISEEWYRPPCITGVGSVGFGVTLVWSGRDIYPSEVNQPHAYPQPYRLTLDDAIVRVVSVLSPDGSYTAVVLTEGRPVIITGNDPAKLAVSVIPVDMPCVSASCVTAHNATVFFGTHGGIAQVTATSCSLVTATWIDTQWWREAGSSSYQLSVYDHRLFAFSSEPATRSFMMNLSHDSPYAPQDMVFLSARASAVSCDATSGLSVTGLGADTGTVWQWEGADYALGAVWQSGIMTNAGRVAYTAGKCLTDSVPIREEAARLAELVWHKHRKLLLPAQAAALSAEYPEKSHLVAQVVAPCAVVEVFGDKRKVFYRHVWSAKPFRLPRKMYIIEVQVQVTTTTPVYELHLAPTMAELTGG